MLEAQAEGVPRLLPEALDDEEEEAALFLGDFFLAGVFDPVDFPVAVFSDMAQSF